MLLSFDIKPLERNLGANFQTFPEAHHFPQLDIHRTPGNDLKAPRQTQIRVRA